MSSRALKAGLKGPARAPKAGPKGPARAPKAGPKGPARAKAKQKAAARRRVPHYRQTTDFTCGPSSVMMAMRFFDPASPMDRATELALWREATTIFMGPSGGHGGCGALGLALALRRRGYRPEVHLNHRDVLLGDRARSSERREIMRVLQARDLAEAKRRRIPIRYGELSVPALEAAFEKGALPIVLCNTRHIHGDTAAHWIVVTGFDDAHVYVNDPWVALDEGKRPRDMTDRPVERQAFQRMACYGKKRERAVVLVRR
jgi:hypothetical protein